MDSRRLLIVSGLSGAGKTVALHALEDAGYYCVDNLPVGILPAFAAYMSEQELSHFDRVAVGIDARNHATEIAELPRTLDELRTRNFNTELVFVDASDETLVQRFSETRRRHPLSSDDVPLAEAINRERRLLDGVIDRADVRIDTTRMNIHELRTVLNEQVARKPRASVALHFRSFGFKNGVPNDADFVFDLRCLPNPYWDPALRELSGLDAPVREFLDSMEMVNDMVRDITAFLEAWIHRFEQANRSYLTIAFGCTGGRHRSVYVAARIARHFESRERHAVLSHRDAVIERREA